MQMLECAADARMCTAVSGLVTLAEVVKKNMSLMGSCGSHENIIKKRKTATPQNLLYVPTIKFRYFFFAFFGQT